MLLGKLKVGDMFFLTKTPFNPSCEILPIACQVIRRAYVGYVIKTPVGKLVYYSFKWDGC